MAETDSSSSVLTELDKINQALSPADNTPQYILAANLSVDECLSMRQQCAYNISVYTTIKQLVISLYSQISSINEKKKVEKRLKEATEVAFSVMTASSQLGELIHFFEKSYNTVSYDDLCALYLQTLKLLNLEGAVLIQVNGHQYFESHIDGDANIGLLHDTLTENRFAETESGLIVRFDKVTSLIYSMPSELDEAYGRIKDNLVTLAEGVNFCVGSIAAQIASVVAERTKSVMLSTISHELRTPMNAIAGFCRILSRKSEGEIISGRDILGMTEVENNVLRLKDLVDDLLSLGDINDDVIAEEKAILPDLLKVPFERVAKDAQLKSIEFSIDSEIPAILMKSDPKRIVQVAKNLLANAVKFTDVGCVSYSQKEIIRNDQVFAVLTITDTGIGISKEDVRRIFEPFIQLDAGTTRCSEGAGIGLSVAKHMVEQLNGWIDVDSQPGKGTQFRVFLPTGRNVGLYVI